MRIWFRKAKEKTYVNKISSMFNSALSIMMLVIGIVTFTLVVVLCIMYGNASLKSTATDYQKQLNASISEKETMIKSMAVTIASGQIKDYKSGLKYVDTIKEADEHLAAAYIAYPHALTYSGGWKADDEFLDIMPKRPWYVGAENTEGIFITDPYIDETTGNFCITLAKAVKEKDKTVAVVGIDMFLDDIVSLISDSFDGSSYTFLVSGDGTIMVHPSNELTMTQKTSVNVNEALNGRYKKVVDNELKKYTVKDYAGGLKVMMSAKLSSGGWTVVTVKPFISYYGLAIILLLMIIAIFAFVLISSSRFFQKKMKSWFVPIVSISEKMELIASGNLDVRFDEEKVTKEIEQLTDALNDTTVQLKFYIGNISQVVDNISNNNLAINIDAEYKGEFNKIKHSLEDILDKLNNTFSEIGEQSNEVVMYSNQVQQATEKVAFGAMEQTESINSLMEEIDIITQQSERITQNAKKAVDVTNQTNEKLRDGSEEMRELVTAIDVIMTSTSKINEIIAAINDIADQTNLLSLNASIEAARAGESGKGFVIVADEISKLAKASTQASANINNLIEDANQAAKVGKDKADITFKTLTDGMGNSVKSQDKILEITEFVQNQTDAIEKIQESVRSIAAVIKSNASATQENTAISDELIACATKLKDNVHVFDLRQ